MAKWEIINADPSRTTHHDLWRIEVPRGWLYKSEDHLVFVPRPREKEQAILPVDEGGVRVVPLIRRKPKEETPSGPAIIDVPHVVVPPNEVNGSKVTDLKEDS